MNAGELDWIGMGLLGLLGTGHCIGMCGPLIFAFPGRSGRFWPHVWYHLGRITTYTAAGAAIGGIGQAVARAYGGQAAARVAGVQWVLVVAAAVLLIVMGLMRLQLIREPAWLAALSPERLPGFGTLLQRASQPSARLRFFLLGLVLGLLPCGLSYAAFARALSAGSAAAGGGLVLAFALGTVPGLLLLGVGLSTAFTAYRRHSDRVAGALMIVMALMMLMKVIRAAA